MTLVRVPDPLFLDDTLTKELGYRNQEYPEPIPVCEPARQVYPKPTPVCEPARGLGRNTLDSLPIHQPSK